MSDEELQMHLARSKQQFEESVAKGEDYESTNILYRQFVAARDELIRRLRQAEGSQENRLPPRQTG